ncbi:Senescence regulator [Corchorus olitorius]|uniref:Senescence regulator n=1 Tax=Corchorus olitorius TaxID=93759 RepID=A0A1R3H3N5_9ROSI|nr:Senescence regulator [Corchorus olitorius]
MAKGRRLTTSRSERFLGSYGYGHNQGDSATDEPELGEEDVWSMVDSNAAERDDQNFHNSQSEWSPRAEAESNGNGNSDMRGGRRRVPRGDRHVGGLSLAFEDSSSTKPRIVHQFRNHDGLAAAAANSPRGHHMATSAPVNVPDWSKIYRVDSVESIHDSDDGLDDRDSEMVPPHEYLAREYARSKKAGGASVVEGVGRTLKGRDMRRVRDAVWSQTGFYG